MADTKAEAEANAAVVAQQVLDALGLHLDRGMRLVIEVLRPHVERETMLAREVEGLRAEVKREYEARGQHTRTLNAEINALTKEGIADRERHRNYRIEAEEREAELRAPRDHAKVIAELEKLTAVHEMPVAPQVEAFCEFVRDYFGVPTGFVPVPLFLTCPLCKTRHVDKGGFALKPHHTHSCQNPACGLTWRPAVVPTVGVHHLPGFLDKAGAAPCGLSKEGALAWAMGVIERQLSFGMACSAQAFLATDVPAALRAAARGDFPSEACSAEGKAGPIATSLPTTLTEAAIAAGLLRSSAEPVDLEAADPLIARIIAQACMDLSISRSRERRLERAPAEREVSPAAPTLLDTLRADGSVKVDLVHVEVTDARAGWAVFSGCDGEDPELQAFFPGVRGKDHAARMLTMTIQDGDEQVLLVFDGAHEPALACDLGIVVANHKPDAEGIAVLAKLFDVPASEWSKAS